MNALKNQENIKLILDQKGYIVLRKVLSQSLVKKIRKKIIKSLKKIQYNWYSPGIRAQLYNKESLHLENDIVIENNDKSFHLLNSISPAWTCAFKTSKYVLNKIKSYLV
tara:strand:- start:4259 stop:4585 length:327 start_codon:yes stop_codon:yes gene_type:complete